MKSKNAILGVTVCAALILASGCSKEEPAAGEMPETTAEPASGADATKAITEAASQTASEAQKAASQTVSQAQEAASQVATEAQQAASQAAGEAQNTAQTMATQAKAEATAATSAASGQAQALIDKAKALVTDQKYQDALTTLQQLASVQLTPEQQKLVDDLKAQIQTALAKKTASDALGGVLGGKK